MQQWTRAPATFANVMLVAIAAGGCSPGTPMPREIGQSRPVHTTEEPIPDASTDGQVDAGPADAAAGNEDTLAPESASVCPEGMVLAQGAYCPEVEHTCLGYLDPPGRYHEYRCGEYAPARCAGPRESMKFCIDAREYTPPNQSLPAHFVSFRDAKRICGGLGKRLCLESEWNFACEGEQMLPYPYGSKREASICNADHTDLRGKDGGIRDQRAPSGAHQGCVSPFGVYDMAGNLEEFVERDDAPGEPAMKGAWWLPGRNHCRARQTFHNEVYKGVETGFRCCADVVDESVAPEERPLPDMPNTERSPVRTIGCINFRTARGADGGEVDCYPYRCRNGRCLTRCKSMADCAGAQRPQDIAKEGWPLECLDECVPMHPDKVNP